MSNSAAVVTTVTLSEKPSVWARVRLADRQDVPNTHRLIHKMAEFELLTHLFSAKETSLVSTLFPVAAPPPFHSFILLILEISPTPIPDEEECDPPVFSPITRRIDLGSPMADSEAAEFESQRGRGRTMAGFVLCFPNYSTLLAKQRLYVEDLLVREAWRWKGLGRILMSEVAAQEATMGMELVEWCVLNRNANTISFYEGMGAKVLQQWRICRLTGPALRAYGEEGIGSFE